ncbi:MAG TPA: hypothetical protein VJ813_08845 [Vicinamibacterales bacterium]|nr:hypothetical protein [Vicinamibacterales bacterium]
MIHLTDVQLTDAAEGRLDPEASAHLADCAVCTKSVDEMRAVLDSVASVSVPEPSPLFWEHFGMGVNAGIVQAPEPVRSWLPPGALAWLGAAAVLLLSVIGYYATRPSFEAAPAAPAAALGEPPALLDAAPDDVEADEAWALMRSLAVDLHYDDARDAGVLPGPGSVERAATELSEAERAELVRLIQDELKRMGA